MAAIKFDRALVFLAPTRGRRYLTRNGAATAESRAMMAAKYPSEDADFDGEGRMIYPGYHWSSDPRLVRVQARLARILAKQAARTQDASHE